MEEDPRFANKLKQAKFRRIPQNQRKVKIDKRFKSMFKDDKFQVKYTVDKRGRPVNNTAKEDLRRYYAVSSSESDEEEEEKTATINEEEDETAAIDDDNFAKQDGKISDKVKRKLKNLKIDYARGEGVLLSDSSSDDDEESDDEEEEDRIIDHAWGELDQDAEHTTEITCRLAACNMNWDRVRAVDLMVLLNCFLPSGGIIQSVTIYPSEFGIKRMQEEELKGPIELVESEGKDDEDRDGSKYHMEKLRQYELNRLKYYYAVVVFDDPKSANKVYEECDGLEYESTSTKFDLRFIPDDVTFDQEPKDVCTKLPDASEYRPKYFTTCALQQTKVNLTWDETDPNRIEITKRLNSKKDVDYTDVQAYLASTSEEDESEEEVEDEENRKGLSSIDRYKSLLLGLENGESSSKNDDGLEMTWGVDLQEKAEKMVKQKLSEKEKKTPFQMFLEKRKEKKKLKKEAKRNNAEDNDDDDSDDIPSDVDLNDPYFAEELNKKKSKSKKKKNKKVESEEDEDAERQRGELALLLANDDDDGRKHFSLKKIQMRESEEKPKKNRRKKKMVEEEKVEEDDFKIDVQDERFSALYNNHLFSIDPNDPHYKKTKAIAAIENEKLRRREEVPEVKEVKVEEPTIRPETQLLIKRMKRKAEAFNSKNKKIKRA